MIRQAAVMDLVDSDKQKGLVVHVWDTYTHLLHQAGPQVKQHPITGIRTQSTETVIGDVLTCVYV